MSGKQQDVNNPFGDPVDINPFADPYVALSASENKGNSNILTTTATSQQLPTYMEKPPAYESTVMPPSSQSTGNIQPIPTSFQPKPFSATQPGTLQGITPVFPGQATSHTTLNQAELERKANELEAREKELNRLQQRVQKGNNFPPLPSFFPCSPCYYHDISIDIPVSSQKTCKIMFYLWQFYVLTLVVNFISALALLVGGGNSDAGGTTFGVALVFMVLFAPCSFVFWYRPIYKALRDDSSFNYMIFFFTFACQIFFCVLAALGFPKFGTCGWINGFAQISNSSGVAALMIITGIMWTVLTVGMVLYLKRIHAAYRSSGASFEKAQGEFAVGIASNKAVQNVAIETMRAGVAGGSQAQTRN